MSSPNQGSALWPVLLGMGLLLSGAMALEAAGRAKEQVGEVVVISAGSAADTQESALEDVLLLGDPLDETHAQARRLVRRGQYTEAESILEALLTKYGKKTELLSELGYLQLVRGHTQAAERTLIEARLLAPGNAWLALTLATASKRDRKMEQADKLYHEALKLRPHYSAAKLALGRFLRQQNRSEEALKYLEEISTSGSNDDRASALAELGRCYLELGRDAEANAAFEKAIGRAPASVSVRISIAQAYMDSGSPEQLARSTKVLQRAISLAPASPRIHAQLGSLMVLHKNIGAARAAFEKSLDLDPNYSYARRKLLRLDMNAGDYGRARAHVRQLLATDNKNAEFHFLSGLVEARDGKLDEARRAYSEAIELTSGGYPEAHMNLGNLERRAKNFDKAIMQYRIALDVRPGYKQARNNLGLALLGAGNHQAAIKEFESLVSDKPQYAEAWLNLAKAHASDDRFADAISALREAIKVRPGYPAAELNLASALRKSGEPTEAVAVYDKIIKVQPRYVSAWYNRGIALEEAQKPEAARSSYQEALRLDTEHRLSLKRLARLELRGENYGRAEALYTEILDRGASDAKARRLRAETRAGQGDSAGCLHDAEVARKQEPKNENLDRLFSICNQAGK